MLLSPQTSRLITPALFSLIAVATVTQAQTCDTTWKCHHISKTTNRPPTLDANLTEWADVNEYTSDMVMITGTEYNAGDVSYKCQYDDEQIYFAFEIPGDFRFNATNNRFCAAIGTMFKVGSKASFLNMGGCPDAMAGCPDGVPHTCEDYLVDIGAHWELSGTEQNTFYGVSETTSRQGTRRQLDGEPTGEAAGNDVIANKDDEYAVSAFCRFDDNDDHAGNEWSGAWAHTNPIDGEFGAYHFEMSRTLKTESTYSDAQLTPGETIEFGVAFWDPFETEETGWSEIGHYVTGCGTKWIDLELVDPNLASTTDASASGADAATSVLAGVVAVVASLLAIA